MPMFLSVSRITMKTIFFLAASVLLLPACQQTIKPEKERPVQIDTMQLVALPATSVKVASNEVSVVSRDSTTYVRFGDSYFSLDWIRPDERRNDFELNPDTLFFRQVYLHSIEGQMLAVTTAKGQQVKVSQCYETSAVIEQEPLLNWKHYRSPWENLPAEASNFFICKKYSASERSRFPPTTVHSLQEYIKKQSTPVAYSQVARLERFPALPVRIKISRYYIRMDGLQRNTTKLFIIEPSFRENL